MNKYRVIMGRSDGKPVVTRHKDLPDAMRRVDRVLSEHGMRERQYKFDVDSKDFSIEVGSRGKRS